MIFLLGSEFTKAWAAHHGSAAAFAARAAAPGTTVPAPTKVEQVIAHGAQHRSGIGVFDVVAVGALIVFALREKRGERLSAA